MSKIDLTDSQVRANYINSKIQEGEGKFFVKKDVMVFKDEHNNEHVVPNDMKIPEDKKKDIKVLEESPVQELKEENDKLKKENQKLKTELNKYKKNKS